MKVPLKSKLYDLFGFRLLSYIVSVIIIVTLETSLVCILLLASRDVHFDKRMICFLSDLL